MGDCRRRVVGRAGAPGQGGQAVKRHLKKATNLTRFLVGCAVVVVGFWLIMGSGPEVDDDKD